MTSERRAPTEKTRNPFVRFVVLLVTIVAILVTYAFAFQRTDIGLEEVKDEGRRAGLVRIIRGLAKPDIIEYDEETVFHTVDFMTPCPEAGFEPTPPGDPAEPYLEAIPQCADPRDEIRVIGRNFPEGTRAPLSFIPPSGVTLKLADVEADRDGMFDVTVRVPDRAGTEVQELRVTTRERVGSWQLTKSAKDTWEKIIETVMLALVATTIGTIAAIPLSFLSARNLMRAIRTPINSVALFVVGFPIGLLVGRQLGRWVAAVGDRVSDNVPILVAASLGLALGGWWILRATLPEEEAEPPTLGERVLRRLVVAAVAVAGLFVIGFVGHLLREVGGDLEGPLGPFGFLGDFLRVIGDVMVTFLTAIAAVVTGLVVAAIGSRMGHLIADRARPGTVLLARFVFVSLAVAITAAAIGGAVRWLYALQRSSNAMATTAGGAILGLVVGVLTLRFGRRWFPDRLGIIATFLRLILGMVGIAIGIGIGIVLGVAFDALAGVFGADGTIVAPALLGAALGVLGVAATRSVHSLPSGLATYYASRTLFNGIRSVEPLIMAIVFVVWVGIGPFAGSLALALHTTAALAKLYSEQVESILPGPIEAVTATGATRLQTIIYAVVPQIVPPYIAFTLYRWDINVRMSTIIGFAGGGGIGFLLQQNINLLQYRAAAVQMLAIAVVVSTLDFVSARIRERIV